MEEPHIQLLSRREYFEDLARRAAAAGPGDRLVVVTMSFDPADAVVRALLGELAGAAKRGAQVSFILDAYVYLIHGGVQPGPLFWHPRMPSRLGGPFRLIAEALARLQESGVAVTLLNLPKRAFTVPVAGRSHIKYALVNDRVYIGGCNLDWGNKVDIMAAWDDGRSAQWLYDLTASMTATGSARAAVGGEDLSFKVSNTDTLLVDAGARNRSLIFDEAMELIDTARERVFIACQFFPNAATAEHLLRAHQRGVKVEILYNHANQQAFPHNILHHLVVARERRRLPASFFVQSLRRHQPVLHAKLIVTEQGSIMGSHNFVVAGVQLGTAEIALLSSDSILGDRAIENLRSQINA